MAVPNNYFASVEPVEVPVNIPRSYLKTMRIYVHPSLTRAFVAPTKNDMTAQWYTMGLASWTVRASELIPAYEGALQEVLKARKLTCRASSPVAFTDVLGFEFALACD